MSNARFSYIAVSRGIFWHPHFAGRDHWLRAWIGLIAMGAWAPRSEKVSGGNVELKRGDVATTVRDLAKEWRWPKSSVSYFLNRLEDEAMILRSVSRPRSGTRFGTKN